MTPQQWEKIKSVVNDALEHGADQRSAFLRQACQGDEDVRREAERLLAHAPAISGFISPIEDGDFESSKSSATRELTGQRVGGYRIISRIASGGMGTVFHAEQDNPRRSVALKIIQFGFVNETMVRRFAYEAQMLARLRHPGIVQIYEAGSFDLGDGARPFFAMELVSGDSILEYAGRLKLTTAQRLELMVKICHAVQHAHQNGVIHRDLKPANILIDQQGQPKILDFGVARAIDSDVQMTTMHTRAGELVGSIRYMSPEQFAGVSDEIDTRCDVYALGVICYELLSGKFPYAVAHASSIAEWSNVISREEPIRLGKADRRFRGDLDTILAKVMEKDPGRRYASAGEFAADLERFLGNQPVAARRPTASYQLSKFARRHRVLAGGVAAVALALAGGIVLYSIEAARANHAAQMASQQAKAAREQAVRAEAVGGFLINMLAGIDPNSHGRNVDLPALVENAAKRIASAFADQPLHRAAVDEQVGTIYYNLGLFDEAAEHYETAWRTRVEILGPDHLDSIACLNSQGLAMMRSGRLQHAEELLRQALEKRIAALGQDDPQSLATMNNLAMLHQLQGNLEGSRTMLERALAGQQRTLGPSHRDTLTTMTNLASLHRQAGELEQAEGLHREALAGFQSTLGETHATTLVAMSNLAGTLKRTGALEEAEVLYRRAAEGLAATLGEGHNDALVATHNLGQLLQARGEFGEAETCFRRALDGFRANAGAQSDAPLVALKNLGRSLHSQGKLDEAHAAFHEALQQYQLRYGENDPRTVELRKLLDSTEQQTQQSVLKGRQ